MNSPRNNTLTPLSALLLAIHKDSQTLKSIQSISKIQALWCSAVPSPLRENAQPTHYRNGLLVVHVPSPVWAQKLRFRQKELISLLRREAELKNLSSLSIRLLPVANAMRRQPKKSAPLRPGPETARLLNDVADSLHDEGLKRGLRRIAAHAKPGKKLDNP